jgi:hypothetical protein
MDERRPACAERLRTAALHKAGYRRKNRKSPRAEVALYITPHSLQMSVFAFNMSVNDSRRFSIKLAWLNVRL